MSAALKPLQIIVYQDVLCAWCYVASSRLDALRQEFRETVRWRTRPFPLRLQDALPSERERAALTDEVERARREPDGAARALSVELWSSQDPPRSSVPALVALEAARLQGSTAQAYLARAMQRAALEQGVNVTRTDVIFELAGRVGLSMNTFVAAFNSPETRQWVLEEHRVAASRGVRGVPTLVIGGRWMLSGLRELDEYREHILRCMSKLGVPKTGTPERLVH